jgi:hypothetical protein
MSKHLVVVDFIQSPNGEHIGVKGIQSYHDFLTNDDFDSDDLINKRAVLALIASTPSPSTAIAHTFDVVSGVDDNPLLISILDFPDYGPNSFFIYECLIGGQWLRFGDFQVTVLETSGIFTGFSFYGHDDGTGKFAEDARITMISGPASSTGSGTSVLDLLLASANEWAAQQTFDVNNRFKKGSFFATFGATTLTADRTLLLPDKTDTLAVLGDVFSILGLANEFTQIQTFDADSKYKNGSFFATFGSNTLTANRTLRLPDKTGTIAVTSDLPSTAGFPIQKSLTGTSDGVNPIITIAHALSFTPTSAIVQANDLASAGIVWVGFDATNVYIHYTGLIPPVGAVHYSGSFKA